MGKLILLIVVVTFAVYLTVRLIETRGRLFRRPETPPPSPRSRPSRPLGPDDDPDFLRDLNRRPRKGDPDS